MGESRHFDGRKRLSRQGLRQVEQGPFACSGVYEQIAPFNRGMGPPMYLMTVVN